MSSRGDKAPHFLSSDALKHFKTYQYSSVDKSPVSYYVLRHYWDFCVEFLPLWLAPNTVTLIGFLFIIGNVALLNFMDPELLGPQHAWVSYSYAFGVWAYSTMDNIDGKQARRTGTSSGLGELFDHGIDSLNCTLASLLEASAMAMGCTKLGAFTALIPCLPMYFSCWETYHTHTLYLGYVNGPTEGLMIASLFMAASGYFGPQLWREPIADLVGFERWLGQTNTLDIWAVFIGSAFLIGHLPSCIKHVIEARRKQKLPIAPVFLEWIQMIVFSVALMAWLGSPYSSLLRDNHLPLLCLTLSLVFGRMTTKIILAHLTKQPFPQWTFLLNPAIVGAILVWLPLFGLEPVSAEVELYFLWGYFALANVVYFRWAYLVVTAICDYLGIRCLTIPPEKVEAARKAQDIARAGSKKQK